MKSLWELGLIPGLEFPQPLRNLLTYVWCPWDHIPSPGVWGGRTGEPETGLHTSLCF